MASIEEKIRELEEEIKKTQYNKATQHHIGKLKAKIARLRGEREKRQSKSSGEKGYSVKKSGNATVAFVGFPSVGKSTLLNKLTGAESAVGAYNFTTLTVVPGILEYRGARIQLLDLPGLIKGASKGRGRGREVLSVVRNADLILLMLDVYELNVKVLINELRAVGLRLDEKPADIFISKTDRGGILVNSTVKQTHIDDEIVRDILKEYGIINAIVVLREDITDDQLIDHIAGNRVYVPSLTVINKIDAADPEYIEDIRKRMKEYNPVYISAEKQIGVERLKKRIFETLKFMRIYLRPRGGEPDFEEPLIVREGATVGDVCDVLHREFRRNFRYANVWGKSARFPGQSVSINHRLMDGDILTIVTR